ncbi:hypothetical protein, partial [Enterobacter adelaidei]
GMFARATIDAGDQPALVVPSASVLYRENRLGVFVVDAGKKVHFRRIDVLATTGDRVAAAGLNPGETVVQSMRRLCHSALRRSAIPPATSPPNVRMPRTFMTRKMVDGKNAGTLRAGKAEIVAARPMTTIRPASAAPAKPTCLC